MSRIITRLFDTFSDAQHAVVELERVGVPHGDISLVSHQSDRPHAGVQVREPHDQTAGQAAGMDAGVLGGVGGLVGAAGGVLAGLGIIAIPGLGPVVAAGWLASAAAGLVAVGVVGAAAGGILGALTNAGVSKAEAEVYAEGVRRGGTLVSAKVDGAHIDAAEAALDLVPYVDVVARGEAYRQSGWAGFDDAAPPYSEEEILAERARYRR